MGTPFAGWSKAKAELDKAVAEARAKAATGKGCGGHWVALSDCATFNVCEQRPGKFIAGLGCRVAGCAPGEGRNNRQSRPSLGLRVQPEEPPHALRCNPVRRAQAEP
jgi:hypothetical protein